MAANAVPIEICPLEHVQSAHPDFNGSGFRRHITIEETQNTQSIRTLAKAPKLSILIDGVVSSQTFLKRVSLSIPHAIWNNENLIVEDSYDS